MQENSKINYRPAENIHIVLWLLKDLCWCTLSKTLGIIMVIPTIALAIYITFLYRNNKAEVLHNTAIIFWICANSTWMIGEFYFEDGLRNYALVFFSMGIVVIGYYYVSEFVLRKKNKLPNK